MESHKQPLNTKTAKIEGPRPSTDAIADMTPISETSSEQQLSDLLEKMIQNLSSAINEEFNKNAQTSDETLFCLPDLNSFNFHEKAQMARDLADLLFQCKTNRESIRSRQSLENIRGMRVSQSTPVNRNWGEILTMIYSSQAEPIYMTPIQIKELVATLLHFCGKSKTHNIKTQLFQTQLNYINTAYKLNKINTAARKKEDERSYMENANSKLDETIKLMKKHEKKLEKQLEDCMYENYLSDEYNKQIQAELEEARDALRELLKESPTHMRQQTAPMHKKSVSSSIIVERPRNTFEEESTNPFLMKK